MSDSDSFIEEVSEEVRRDKLFRYIRRYGWIAVVAVLALVGGAAWNEYSKARDRAAAEARGDAILAALTPEDAADRRAALAAIEDAGPATPVVAMLQAASAEEAGDPAAAAEILDRVIADDDQPALYRDLARLKKVLLAGNTLDPAARIEELTPLAAPGAPFRVLAEEQIALAEIERGETAAGLDRLKALLDDTETSAALRRRAERLIVALEGEPDPA